MNINELAEKMFDKLPADKLIKAKETLAYGCRRKK